MVKGTYDPSLGRPEPSPAIVGVGTSYPETGSTQPEERDNAN